MPLAVILLTVEAGADKEVFETLKKLPEVKSLYMVFGFYDIVAIIECPDLDKLKDTVFKHLRSLPKIKSSLTMVVAESFERK